MVKGHLKAHCEDLGIFLIFLIFKLQLCTILYPFQMCDIVTRHLYTSKVTTLINLVPI